MRLVIALLLTAMSAFAESLSLRDAIDRALQNSPDLRASLAQQERGHQAYREAKAQFIPNLVIGSGLAATRGMPLSIEGSAPSLFQVQSSALILNMPQRHAVREAQYIWQSVSAAASARRDEVIWRTASIYLELHKTQRSLEFARKEIEGAARIERAVAERVREGRDIQLELSRARLTSARLRQRAIGIEGQAEILAATLRGLLGMPETAAIETMDSALPPAETLTTAEQSIERALAANEDIRRLEREVAARESRVRAERAQRWPQFDLIGQYAMLSRANNYDRFFRAFERHNAQLGIAMRFTIFDGNRIDARVGQAESELMQSRAVLAAARNDISVAATRAFRDVRAQEAAREVARLDLDVAREALSVAMARFEEGRISAADLEQSRAEESGKWIAWLDATFQHDRARLDLLRHTGRLMAAVQ